MFLSAEIVHWAIRELGKNCHPFVGITFLVCKEIGLPVGRTKVLSLDSATKAHLGTHHRLDPGSEFYFQPFKSQTYWVAPDYASSGLQGVNTRTFKDAFIHTKGSRNWGLVEGYSAIIRDLLHGAHGHGPASLGAMAVWTGKEEQWDSETNLESVIKHFVTKFQLTDEEIDELFDSSVDPGMLIPITGDQILDLKTVAYGFATPPDAPSETEGTLATLQLLNVGPAKEFFLEFGKRLTLIAGDNGLGKSFLLDAAWWALTTTWAGRAAYPFTSNPTEVSQITYGFQNAAGQELEGESVFDWKFQSWPPIAEDLPSVSALCIYARVDGSFAVADVIRGQLRTEGPKALTVFTAAEMWEGKAGEIEGLIRDWVSWQLSSDTASFTMLTRVLEHLSPEDVGPLVPSNPMRIPGDPRQIPTVRHVYGDVPVVYASAGVQRVMLLAYLMIWSWQEHLVACKQVGADPLRKMVVVVDELEAHLHPKWQRLVLPGLMSVGKLLSEDLEVQVIAATHSPMVLASVEGEFTEESDSLLHLAVDEGLVKLERLEFYKYGDISTWLVSPVFGLSHARSRAAERVIEEAKTLQLADRPSLDAVRQVTEQLRKVLSPDDIFWSRWIYFARNLGDDI